MPGEPVTTRSGSVIADLNAPRPARGRRAIVALVVGLALLTTAACTSNASDATSSASAGGDASASVAASTGEVDPTGSDTSAGSVEVETTDPNATSAAAPEVPAPPTTPVPPSVEGNINETVAERSVPTNPPASIAASSDLGNGVKISISETRPVEAIAVGPGEIAGAAVAVTVVISNESAELVDLGSLVVTAQDAAGTPALTASGEPASPILGAVDAGQQVSGVYVFVLPPDHTNPMSYTVSYSPDVPVALFVGDTQ